MELKYPEHSEHISYEKLEQGKITVLQSDVIFL